MAEAAPAGSVQSTAIAAGGTTGAIVVAQWLVDPSWPPPTAVLTVIVGALIPVFHLLWEAICKRLVRVADAIDGPDEPVAVQVDAPAGITTPKLPA